MDCCCCKGKVENVSKLKGLLTLGQSAWLDYIKRTMFSNGEMEQVLADGVMGMTSNPAIFEAAIAKSADYDAEIKELAAKGLNVQEIYERLVVKDIQMAADAFKPVYDATNGVDGFVSLEVSPLLSNDAEGTVKEGLRLFETVGRPNVMIKVPATEAGYKAVEDLTALGVNVNATLIFGLEHYRRTALAYINGLEKLAANGPAAKNGAAINKIASVASFFVSRVDSAVDKLLEAQDRKDLCGKVAIANSRLAYAMSAQIFTGSRWQELAGKGARIQRLLWASTSTKNPAYPDTLYVDELIGHDTVNTIPPATLTAFMDHGTLAETITKDIAQAQKDVDVLETLGIDLDEITEKLQADGVKAFEDSFISLEKSIETKRAAIAG